MASSRMGFVFRDQFCVIGGIDSTSTEDTTIVVADWWCLSDAGDWIRQSDPLPAIQLYYGVAALDDFVYIAGGQNEDSDLVATTQRWPTDTALPAAIDPVICAADADADGDADIDGGEDTTGDTAADADAADADADTTGDTTADTTPDGGGDDGDDGCGCRVTHSSGAGTFLTLLLALGALFVSRRRRG